MIKEMAIITGLSGAGKSNAVKIFEDMGFFCIDNLPAPLIPKFAELCQKSDENITIYKFLKKVGIYIKKL